MNEKIKKENLLSHNYIIQPTIIAKGGFGNIYLGEHRKTREPVAIKTEHHVNTTLRHETRILQYLYENGVRKIPSIYWYGIFDLFSVKCQVLILPFFSCNLETYIQHKHITSLQLSVLMLKCIDIIQHIHQKFVIHRDIKPANFMIKNGDIYLIDFGLATFYLDEHSCHVIDHAVGENDISTKGSMVGTIKYASLYIHRGHRHSRRDDIISLTYLYDYMKCGGTVSWIDRLSTENTEYNGERTDIHHPLNQRWMKSKQQYMLALSTEKDAILFQLYHLVYALGYEETPDYYKIKLLIQTI